ncbi:hypothetical protein [[Eubacterium] cellulosolvens]
MINIAESHGIKLYSDNEWFFSFTNSPYYSHKQLSSIDIYPKRGVNSAFSPVEGTVIEARKLKLMDDYFLAIRSGNHETCVKILHVKPTVQIGDHLNLGDEIGQLIWSPFFDFWTDLHMHLEVRSLDDRLRAGGAYPIDPKNSLIKNSRSNNNQKSFRVEMKSERYALLTLDSKIPIFSTPLALEFDDLQFFLEGGLPHYGHGAFWTPCKGPQENLKSLKKLIQIDFMRKGYIHFFYLNSDPVIQGVCYKGIGLYLNDPHIKIIPKRIGEVGLKVDDEISCDEILKSIRFHP